MKNIPETKARMVRWGRMCPMLLMMKAVKTKSSDTMGKGVAVLTISGRRRKRKREVKGGRHQGLAHIDTTGGFNPPGPLLPICTVKQQLFPEHGATPFYAVHTGMQRLGLLNLELSILH